MTFEFLIAALAAQLQPEASTQDRKALSPAQHYLNAKQAELRSRSGAAQRMGADARVKGVLTILEQRNAFASADVIGNTPAELDAVRAALRETAAHDMVAFGLGPETLQGPQGETRLAAIERLTLGRETLADLVALGERVVVAEITDELPETPVRSRLGQSIRFSVTDVIKGPAGPTTFQTGSTVSAMFAGAQKGERFLFFLSPSIASFKAAENAPLAGAGLAFQFVPYALAGNRLMRLDSTQTDPAGATLTTVRGLASR